MTIEIQSHSKNWKRKYELERKVLEDIFGKEIKAIEHIGSTSVPKLSAKPIIDIFLAVSSLHNVSYYNDKLQGLNYRYSIQICQTGIYSPNILRQKSGRIIYTYSLIIKIFI